VQVVVVVSMIVLVVRVRGTDGHSVVNGETTGGVTPVAPVSRATTLL
jgi:hypothetical protein